MTRPGAGLIVEPDATLCTPLQLIEHHVSMTHNSDKVVRVVITSEIVTYASPTPKPDTSPELVQGLGLTPLRLDLTRWVGGCA
jgi:hypothetical protein